MDNARTIKDIRRLARKAATKIVDPNPPDIPKAFQKVLSVADAVGDAVGLDIAGPARKAIDTWGNELWMEGAITTYLDSSVYLTAAGIALHSESADTAGLSNLVRWKDIAQYECEDDDADRLRTKAARLRELADALDGEAAKIEADEA